ncbi:Gfo/Idh/MocA family protein [Limnobacter litoralis]|uniref:Oxidoreductase n=1 Tax=Limnobacter litoralis TaxID=481366 RepID=A0ABQ5YNJ3_9BURK|nr:Gfo/Idh/MocA family oxidoreductase [Limnobacter litoralis]GLR26168.1 oxidoreductase [Limnobacter litoralis]
MNISVRKTVGKPIRVAMIGGGVNSAVGRVHEIAMRMDLEYELTAGCFSRDPEFNVQSGHTYGVPAHRVYSQPEEMLRDPALDVDAVVIATPIDSHSKYIHLALDHGLRVISDKPLVSTLAECQQILKRVPLSSVDVMCIFNYTGYPAVREMKHRVDRGEIGQVFKIMIEMPQDSYMRLKNSNKIQAIQPWRLRDGPISCVSLDLFVHMHSLVNYVTGKVPLRVSAWQRAISGVADGLIDEVDVVIDYSDNLRVNAWYGKAALGQRNGLRIRAFGAQGSLEWVQEQPEQLRAADERGNTLIYDRISTSSVVTAEARYNRFKAGHPAGFIEAFANYYTDLAQAMRSGQLNVHTLGLEVAAEGLAVCQAIEESANLGQTIHVPTTGTHHEHSN